MLKAISAIVSAAAVAAVFTFALPGVQVDAGPLPNARACARPTPVTVCHESPPSFERKRPCSSRATQTSPGMPGAAAMTWLAMSGGPLRTEKEGEISYIADLDGARLIGQARPADLTDDHGRFRRVIAVHRVVGGAAGGRQLPGVCLGSGVGRHGGFLLGSFRFLAGRKLRATR